MSELVIRNKDFLERLNGISDDFFSRSNYDDVRYQTSHSKTGSKAGTVYCEMDYLQQCLGREKPIGAPEKYFGQPIRKMVDADPDIWEDFQQKVKYDFAREIGSHTSALLTYYPPGGYVGWHTNADANAYQILFTWSDGNGFFRYWDNEKKEVVTHKDVKGWQARHYYFGSEKDHPSKLCWHSAYSAGQRITLAYKFCNDGIADDGQKDTQAKFMRDMLIEEIESE